MLLYFSSVSGKRVSRKNFQENQRVVNNFLSINLQIRKNSFVRSENRTSNLFQVALKPNLL
ncbi:hypothetical protein LEP1GSC163_2046 [Leptospira santarosai str. CBC379]|uniref:Uncharacterized protein n=1 Tax=Leptospira santarosai str. MOR084 TaxID=1049984 RepID=A0A0E2BK74_9LEPT|nr:hypothetical protein LEP1GSC179_1136 [Leptospira santarosai str. MOR084]EKR92761.1 hypothetical protein LEP1GSC163_2046 [Leptospira santarosai str. CBC379]